MSGKNNVQKAIADGEIKIGDLIIPCAVLEDGTRVISETGMGRAFGRNPGGKDWKARAKINGIGRLPYFLTANNLKTFINNDLDLLGNKPIRYTQTSGGIAHGLKADLIPNICDVWLKARDAGILTYSQKKIANKADILMRGLAHIGIIALVDEATGYQDFRARDELQLILKAYISEELLPWTKRFPDEFYKHMFRLWGWNYPPSSTKGAPRGPRYSGKLTNELIYDKLPPGVIDELKRLNASNSKYQRKNRFHQFLTNDIGNLHLEKQVSVVIALMKISPNKSTFLRNFARAFPGK